MNPKFLLVSLLILPFTADAGLLEALGLRKPSTNAVAGSPTLAELSEGQVAKGLKEALSLGLDKAVRRLGQPGGFLSNATVRIPMPEQLRTVERTLRTLKQDKLADDFVASMNNAAEQAVPEAAGVFTQALKSMSVKDAKDILTGPENAATTYFRTATETNLHAKLLPIVQEATGRTGVTTAYKRFTEKLAAVNRFGGLGGVLAPESLDLDAYVTRKATDGLFLAVAEEERKIRENPAARTSELLRKVFGAVRPSSATTP